MGNFVYVFFHNLNLKVFFFFNYKRIGEEARADKYYLLQFWN